MVNTKKTKTSIANMSIQLRLLEALDLVEKQKLSTVTRGKPRTLYSLKKDFAYIVYASDVGSDKKFMKLNKRNKLMFNILFLIKSDLEYYLQKFIFNNYDLFHDIQSLSFIGATENEIELFFVMDNPQKYYEKYSNYIIEKGAESKKVKLYLHNKKEIMDGVFHNNEYFISLVTKSTILYDDNQFLIKQQGRGKNKNE